MKDQNYSSDAALAALIGQSTMYDRVKRRSSAVTKDEEKKAKALEALKEKNQKV